MPLINSMMLRPYCIVAAIVLAAATLPQAAVAEDDASASKQLSSSLRAAAGAAYQTSSVFHDHDLAAPSSQHRVLLGGAVDAEMMSSGTMIDVHGNPVGRSPDASGGHGRKLVTFTGDKTVIVVRVKTNPPCTLETAQTAAQLEDDFFDDTANLATQFFACSHGKLNIIKGADKTSTDTTKATDIVNGIVTVFINRCDTGSAYDDTTVMFNEAYAALNDAFGVASPKELADHLYFLLPIQGAYNVGVNSWYVVLPDSYASDLSEQMFTMGRNLNFKLAYADHVQSQRDQSTVMGKRYFQDDAPLMCFDYVQTWQTGWFTDKSLTIDPNDDNDVGICFSDKLYGLDSYDSSPTDAKVLIQLQSTSGNHYHIGFNGAQGANVGTQEHANEVLIYVDTFFSPNVFSYIAKISHLGVGDSYTISDYDGVVGKDVVISVTSISGTDYAEIEIDCGNAWPSSEPSSQPSTSEPTSQPSTSSMPSCTPSSTPTASPSVAIFGVNLFYPKWSQGDEGCRNDGDEPDYMAVNPTEWLSSTLDVCCKKFFGGYNYDKCMGKYPPDHDDCNIKLFYPDWHGANKGCVSDGKEPYYMITNPNMFLFNTLDQCCKQYYEWDYYNCAGKDPPGVVGKYFPDWENSDPTCVNQGDVPPYMILRPSVYLFNTLKECCDEHFSWAMKQCMGTTGVGSGDWYVNWGLHACAQDCDGPPPCGGLAEEWDDLYKTSTECCEKKLSYVNKRECVHK